MSGIFPFDRVQGSAAFGFLLLSRSRPSCHVISQRKAWL
jgi:hypothetical protein